MSRTAANSSKHSVLEQAVGPASPSLALPGMRIKAPRSASARENPVNFVTARAAAGRLVFALGKVSRYHLHLLFIVTSLKRVYHIGTSMLLTVITGK